MIKEIFKKKIPISANRFLNIKDIQGNFLYTTDGKVLAYLKIYPKNSNHSQHNIQHCSYYNSLIFHLRTNIYCNNFPIFTAKILLV